MLCRFIRALRCAGIGHGWFAQETMMAVVTSLAGTRHRRRDSPTPSSITLCKVILPISGVHALSISLLMQQFQFPFHHLLCHPSLMLAPPHSQHPPFVGFFSRFFSPDLIVALFPFHLHHCSLLPSLLLASLPPPHPWNTDEQW